MAITSEVIKARKNSARLFNKELNQAFIKAADTADMLIAYYAYFKRQDKTEQKSIITYLTSIMEEWNSKPLKEQAHDEILRAEDGDYSAQAKMAAEMKPEGW